MQFRIQITSGQSFTLPIGIGGYTLNFLVNWGDGSALGTVTAHNDPDATHTYGSTGEFTITLTGTVQVWFCGLSSSINRNKIVGINYIGNVGMKLMNWDGCANLADTLDPAWLAHNPTLVNLARLFHGCVNMPGTLTGGMFSNCPLNITMEEVFRDCVLVTGSIPGDLLVGMPLVIVMDGLFRGSGVTGSIPGDLFIDQTVLQTCRDTFNTTAVSGTIPSTLFVYATTHLSTISACFANTPNFVGPLAGDMFDANTSLANVSQAWLNSGVNGDVPAGLFDACALTSCIETFRNSGITSIPDLLLANHAGLFLAFGTFRDTAIDVIPGDLFLNSNGMSLTFAECFRGCVNILEIPVGLFITNNNCVSLSGTWQGCTGINVALPSGLLDGLVDLTNLSNAWNGCSAIPGGVPANFLDDCTSLTNILAAWSGCVAMTGVLPSGLLVNCTLLNNAASTWLNAGTTGTIPASFFPSTNTLTNMNSTFNGTDLTGIDSGAFDPIPKVTNYSDTIANTSISAAGVDNFLISIDNTNTATGFRAIDYSPITGNGHLDANRSGAGTTAKNNLISEGWTRSGSY